MKSEKPSNGAVAPHTKHGLTIMKEAFKQLGARALDNRTSVALALKRWRAEIITSLGGEENVSAQRKTILDFAVRTKLMLDSVDAWLLTQGSLVNKRNRCLYPVVLQRQQLADALARYLTQIGLEKQAKRVPTLQDYLAQKETKTNGNA